MARKYLELAVTPAVQAAQRLSYGRSTKVSAGSDLDPLGAEEIAFIGERDSFYMATVSETGWPYIQHRGGKPGFLRVLDAHTLGFADYRGNRQLLSAGNVSVNDRVSLFLMDYLRRERLKILGYGRVEPASRERLELVEPAMRDSVERFFVTDVVSFDWNCPKFITQRYTAAEVEAMVRSLREKLGQVEAELAAVKNRSLP